jgi:hypothetical protein
MRASHVWMASVFTILSCAAASAQGSAPRSPDAATFIGTWAVTMTEPVEMKGLQHTVRIWDNNGVIAASFQVGKFPAREVTGISKDGGMLVLTVSHDAKPSILENGVPIWAVLALTLQGDTMNVAQMLERSQTIKRGVGKKTP